MENLTLLDIKHYGPVQSASLFRHSCWISRSSTDCTLYPTFVSLANLFIMVTSLMHLSKSLMNITNERGPNKELWGTPDKTSHHSEKKPFKTILCFLSLNQFVIVQYSVELAHVYTSVDTL